MLKEPTPDALKAIASRVGVSLDDVDLGDYIRRMKRDIDKYYRPLEQMRDKLPSPERGPPSVYYPDEIDNVNNAWFVRTSIKTTNTGLLAGKTFAIKDSICVAGLPMMNGAENLRGFVPGVDATVVTRILDAGGEITGKANCECLCDGGGSHTSVNGPVHNPRKRRYSAGGSSSGCAAVVAAGGADMAVGGDQGGSIRIPASFCGIVGLKPTYGLVPYTAAFAGEMTLDHLGPMTASVGDNALLLEVLAGYDGLDPRQGPGIVRVDYTRALSQSASGIRIGVLAEGFGSENAESDVDAAVRQAAEILKTVGADVEEVSIPFHTIAMSIWVAIYNEGMFEMVMRGNSLGTNWQGLYPTDLLKAHSNWRSHANEFSDIVKLGIVFGQVLRETTAGEYYAKAQNLRRQLRVEYDKALADYDLLLMPTTPFKAPKLPCPNAGRDELMGPGYPTIVNLAPFNCTGHPAISIPCASRDGLPVGLMLVGRHFDEFTIYRAAHAFERQVDWQSL